MTEIATLAAARFGYGLPLPEAAPRDAAAIMARLSGPDRAAIDWPKFSAKDWQALVLDLKAAQKLEDAVQKADRRGEVRRKFRRMAQSAQQVSFARAVEAPDGFRERLVAFWVDHFSVAFDPVQMVPLVHLLEEEAIRPHLTATFADLLTAVTLHPAMLLYLDQSNSVGPASVYGRKKGAGLNENLAREVMELHTIGVGARYSQTDVTELAKLLTGIIFSVQDGVGFAKRRAEPGAETVLGQTYDGAGLAPIRRVLSDLAQRSDTAQHIARKLVAHFVADDPDPDLVAAVARAFDETGGGLLATYRALLEHPGAWTPTMAKVRQPFDFLVAASRGLGLRGRQFLGMRANRFETVFGKTQRALGQDFRHPAGPNGFPEEAEAWITPQGLAGRIDWAMQSPAKLLKNLPEPLGFARDCLADRARDELLLAISRAEDRAQAVGLVLASATFNRR